MSALALSSLQAPETELLDPDALPQSVSDTFAVPALAPVAVKRRYEEDEDDLGDDEEDLDFDDEEDDLDFEDDEDDFDDDDEFEDDDDFDFEDDEDFEDEDEFEDQLRLGYRLR